MWKPWIEVPASAGDPCADAVPAAVGSLGSSGAPSARTLVREAWTAPVVPFSPGGSEPARATLRLALGGAPAPRLELFVRGVDSGGVRRWRWRDALDSADARQRALAAAEAHLGSLGFLFDDLGGAALREVEAQPAPAAHRATEASSPVDPVLPVEPDLVAAPPRSAAAATPPTATLRRFVRRGSSTAPTVFDPPREPRLRDLGRRWVSTLRARRANRRIS